MSNTAVNHSEQLNAQAGQYQKQLQRTQIYSSIVREAISAATEAMHKYESHTHVEPPVEADATYSTGNGREYHSTSNSLGAVLKNRCADCHSGSQHPKGVSVDNWRSWDKDMRERVLDSVTRDHNRMPQDEDPLTVRELAEFFKALDY